MFHYTANGMHTEATMSNYIVLVKQVPDVSQITDNAFDPKTGSLLRSRLTSTINELDAKALAFANEMRTKAGNPQAQIVTLSMGPPMAEEVLRYSLSRCADRAILLTDRSLGGADTYATANPLACAIRRIVAELFNGNEDYYIIAGMQSVDGDTAQVPAQIAEELNIPCAAYVTQCTYADGGFQFERIVCGGSQNVALRRKPAMITVADYEWPLFASFERTRWATHFEVIQWSNEHINADKIGAQGSKTQVIRVFPPEKTSRKRQKVDSPQELAEIIAHLLGNAEKTRDGTTLKDKRGYRLPARRSDAFDRSFESTEKESEEFEILAELLRNRGLNHPSEITPELENDLIAGETAGLKPRAIREMLQAWQQTEPSYKGDVWVVAERTEDGLHAGTLELVGKARDLADGLEVDVGVVLATSDAAGLEREVFAAGADRLYLIEDPLLNQFDPAAYRKVIAACMHEYNPQIALFAATPQGRALAPMVSYRLGCGLTADCTELVIQDRSRKGEIAALMQTRPALGGNIMATICTKDSPCQMATVRPGVMPRPEPDYTRAGEIIRFAADLAEEDLSLDILHTALGHKGARFDAEVIVCGGKGLLSKGQFNEHIEALLSCLSNGFGVSTERGASRAAVEQGFIDRGYQVGQTGTSISPSLYLALGISGAIQHMIGVSNARTIIAVNSDSSAPIFEQSDYYIVAKAEHLVPALIEELGQLTPTSEVQPS